jgi:hypothetical protein
VIALAVRWYLRYGLSYRDVEELLAERGVEVDHVTIYGWVQVFSLEFIEAAHPSPPRERGTDGSSMRPTSRSVVLSLPRDRSAPAGDRRAGLDPPKR